MEYIDFPLKNGETYEVTFREARTWEAFFPQLTEAEIAQEFLKMRAWLESHPRKRKTRRGTPAFIDHWLNLASAMQQIRYKVRMEAQVGTQRFLGR